VPTPPKTSVAAIVAAGRRILEAEGPEALTLQAVASAVGVRAPSLYKRINGRGDLVRRIANDAAAELGSVLAAANRDDPAEALRAMAHAVRRFALANPRAYALLFAPLPEDARVDEQLNADLAATIVRAAGGLAGSEHALDAGRMVVAWVHGFMTMELAGAFRLGGDIDRAFEFGVDRIVRGLEP
jgi:AcrR family transcriptional regulator